MIFSWALIICRDYYAFGFTTLNWLFLFGNYRSHFAHLIFFFPQDDEAKKLTVENTTLKENVQRYTTKRVYFLRVQGQFLAVSHWLKTWTQLRAQNLPRQAQSLNLVAYSRPYVIGAQRRSSSCSADLGSFDSTLFVFRLQVSLDKISNDGPVSLISFEDLKMENERLQVELDRTKKVNCQLLPITLIFVFCLYFFYLRSLPRD